jgi:hypothetical protein
MNPADNIAIQYALYRGLRSSSLFTGLNVVLGREYIASKVEQDAVWQSPSPGGQAGIGAIVQIPSLMFPKPNSLQRTREYRIGIYEDPDANFTPDVGTLRAADDWADMVVDFLWNWTLWRASGLILQDRAVVPDARFAEFGIVGVAAVCYLRQERSQPARCAPPVIFANPNRLVQLSNADGSPMYYTTDGFSTPAPDNNGSLPGEQAATLYNGPFAVPPGSIVIAASWPAAGNLTSLPSQTINQLIN